MAEFRDYLISFLLVGLFSIALIMFAVGMGIDNESSTNILDDSRISSAYNALNSSLETSRETANSIKTGFESENPFVGFGSLIFFSIAGAGKLISSIIIGMFLTISTLVVEVIGINPIVFSVVSAILIISLVLLAWKLYRQGS